MKTIKKSERGLTFSFYNDGRFAPGERYDYTIKNGEIIITPHKEGRFKISKKVTKTRIKSLFDLRNKEILKAIGNADSIEVEVGEENIVVYLRRKISSIIHRSSLISTSSIFSQQTVQEIIVPKMLLASGGESFTQLSFFDKEYTGFNSDVIKENISEVFSVLSLFSGCGMLDYPFAKDDSFKIILANDIEEAACESYRENIGSCILNKDIRELKIVLSSDVVLGGVSCKPFSNVNRQKSRLQDHTDYFLVKEYIRIVKQAEPKVIAIENVPEFITTGDGVLLEHICTSLSQYEFTVKVVVDCDLGGYTTRKRVIIIGSRIGKIEFPDEKVSEYKTTKEALDKVDASWFNFSDFSVSRKDTQEKMKYVRDGHNWEDIPPELRGKGRFDNYFRRIAPDKPAPAIVNVRKSCIMPPKEYIKGRERCLSVAECSALSGFPKEFKYLGSLDERQQQVANGVPYSIAYKLKELIKQALRKTIIA